jgi:hypothetical protein
MEIRGCFVIVAQQGSEIKSNVLTLGLLKSPLTSWGLMMWSRFTSSHMSLDGFHSKAGDVQGPFCWRVPRHASWQRVGFSKAGLTSCCDVAGIVTQRQSSVTATTGTPKRRPNRSQVPPMQGKAMGQSLHGHVGTGYVNHSLLLHAACMRGIFLCTEVLKQNSGGIWHLLPAKMSAIASCRVQSCLEITHQGGT